MHFGQSIGISFLLTKIIIHGMRGDAKRFPVVVALQADALPIGLPVQT
ncbi:MAG: hypothetical protein ACI81O_001474 [Cyclobacteriaceae bacterium]